jgi:4-diphosphocytidyl-2-C-methyl-D-erythritol kinase
MAEVRAAAPAKINLLLLAGSPRADGYHPLVTVFQAVDLWEHVSLRPADSLGVTADGVGAEAVPLDRTNLAVRAVEAVAAVAGVEPRAHIHLTKRIPVAGGLAGGSADAAAALLAANALFDAGLSTPELHTLAATLGSDVNFCLSGGTAVGRGRGEHLTPLATGGSFTWVLATRADGLTTPRVFAALDAERGGAPAPLPAGPSSALVEALTAGDGVALGRELANDLQPPAVALKPALRGTLDAALDAGALGAVVSGSGPTVAALAPDAAAGQAIAAELTVRDGAVTALVVSAPAGPAHLL